MEISDPANCFAIDVIDVSMKRAQARYRLAKAMDKSVRERNAFFKYYIHFTYEEAASEHYSYNDWPRALDKVELTLPPRKRDIPQFRIGAHFAPWYGFSNEWRAFRRAPGVTLRHLEK